jgi:phage terminase large subunit-like protein
VTDAALEARSIMDGLSAEDRAIFQEFIENEERLLEAIKIAGVDTYTPLPHQLRLHQSQSPNRWMIGANRMGKSRSIVQEIKWFAEGDHPYRRVPDHGNIWACCPSFEKSQNFQIPEVKAALGTLVKRFVEKPNPVAELTNGKRVIFKTYEQHHQKYASEEPILIAFDEEPPWDIMDESYARRSASHELQIVGAVTMTQGLTWLWDKVLNRAWPESEWFGGAMTDNVYLSREEIDRFDKGTTGVMRQIRFEGKVVPIGGQVVFDPDRLASLLMGTKDTPWQYEWTGSSWLQVTEGPLKVWRFPDKESPDEEFVIGCDPAEGLNTSHSDAEPDHDQTAIHIKSRHRQDIVAEYVSGITEPDMIGDQIAPSLSDLFHKAKFNPERNNHGGTVIAFFKRRYPSRLYVPEVDIADVTYQQRPQYGHLETGAKASGRPYLIDLMRKRIRDDKRYKVPSAKAVRQLLTFVLKSSGKMEHQEGSKDDCVFSLGLCEVLDHELPAVKPLKAVTERNRLRDLALKEPRRRAVDWYRQM